MYCIEYLDLEIMEIEDCFDNRTWEMGDGRWEMGYGI